MFDLNAGMNLTKGVFTFMAKEEGLDDEFIENVTGKIPVFNNNFFSMGDKIVKGLTTHSYIQAFKDILESFETKEELESQFDELVNDLTESEKISLLQGVLDNFMELLTLQNSLVPRKSAIAEVVVSTKVIKLIENTLSKEDRAKYQKQMQEAFEAHMKNNKSHTENPVASEVKDKGFEVLSMGQLTPLPEPETTLEEAEELIAKTKASLIQTKQIKGISFLSILDDRALEFITDKEEKQLVRIENTKQFFMLVNGEFKETSKNWKPSSKKKVTSEYQRLKDLAEK